LVVLEPELLLDAYRRGIFPMAMDKRGTIGWFSPDPRGIIPLDDRFHIPHGLRRALKQKKLEVSFDTDFPAVIRECSKRREGTWISKQIVESYCNLHRLGHAHSVEVWQDCHPERSEGSGSRVGQILRFAQNDKRRKLVGGLYGVHIGGAFFGESMFHRATDASKVALMALVERLRQRGFLLLDTQWQTPHLAQFGTYEIPRSEYLKKLEQALKLECKF
jgi:leucyl/phenylalanyl-tRNA--protein transferase